jgi:hypothetical protein
MCPMRTQYWKSSNAGYRVMITFGSKPWTMMPHSKRMEQLPTMH